MVCRLLVCLACQGREQSNGVQVASVHGLSGERTKQWCAGCWCAWLVRGENSVTPADQEGTGKSGSYGMWNHPRGHVWNVVVSPASS